MPLAVRLEQYTWTTELLGNASFLRSLTNRTGVVWCKNVYSIQVGRSKITNYLELPQENQSFTIFISNESVNVKIIWKRDLGRNWMLFMVKNCGRMFRGKLTYIRYWIDMVTRHWGSTEWSCWTIVCVGNVKLKIGTVHGNVCCSNHFGCRYKKLFSCICSAIQSPKLCLLGDQSPKVCIFDIIVGISLLSCFIDTERK